MFDDAQRGEAEGVDHSRGLNGWVPFNSDGVFEERRLRWHGPKGYYNPILAYGEEKAVKAARDAGANGFIMVDLPPEEAIRFREICTKEK